MKHQTIKVLRVGTEVYDDLTGERVKIVGVKVAVGKVDNGEYGNLFPAIGYWVDNEHLGGARHQWEITEIE